MKVTMDIELRDEPGQLILALEPVSRNKANLISVFHYHKTNNATKTGSGKVQVQLVLDAKSPVIAKIKDDMEKTGIRVLRIGEEKYRETITVIMIGHVVNTDIRDTISRIDETGIAEVTDMSLSMPEIDEPTSAAITINAVGKDELKKVVALLKEITKEKDLLLVLPIELE
ncbi:amino acid-binding protein [Methanimicrococcus blatticola]|uniref:ACT domain-containing protein n=1 Tax=Methanimicrococcus blatticola TaxID=91560 RepID=A0A484F6R9_9EURY|nr:amino acid-binding protein [Methanimicrococcus blatticola]MBZ3935529.1 amino acid-binding protein [Methanimicrococcus blatticola]MCC2509172.1 amino acid-binding protein [Methanimicrococcus blatticola]TDQ69463.1 ACT domain-containing protein [Methanimicrococcus blatticola]